MSRLTRSVYCYMECVDGVQFQASTPNVGNGGVGVGVGGGGGGWGGGEENIKTHYDCGEMGQIILGR